MVLRYGISLISINIIDNFLMCSKFILIYYEDFSIEIAEL